MGGAKGFDQDRARVSAHRAGASRCVARAFDDLALPASRERRPGHIVSPAPPAPGRMARTHPVSAIVIELAREEGIIVRPGYPPCLRLALELLLDPVPGLRPDDHRMKAVVNLPFVAQFGSNLSRRLQSDAPHCSDQSPAVSVAQCLDETVSRLRSHCS